MVCHVLSIEKPFTGHPGRTKSACVIRSSWVGQQHLDRHTKSQEPLTTSCAALHSTNCFAFWAEHHRGRFNAIEKCATLLTVRMLASIRAVGMERFLGPSEWQRTIRHDFDRCSVPTLRLLRASHSFDVNGGTLTAEESRDGNVSVGR